MAALTAIFTLCPATLFTACGDDEAEDTTTTTDDIRPYVAYAAEISDDLQKFVDMEVKYYDGNGELRTTKQAFNSKFNPKGSQSVGLVITLTPKENIDELIAAEEQAYQEALAADPDTEEPHYTFGVAYSATWGMYNYTQKGWSGDWYTSSISPSYAVRLSKVQYYMENTLSKYSVTYSDSYDAAAKTFTEKK